MYEEIKNIGVALDFSPNSKKALRWAIDNLVKSGDDLYIIHVLDFKIEYENDPLWKNWLQVGAPMQVLSEFRNEQSMTKYDLHRHYPDVIEMIDTMYPNKWALVLMKLYYGDAREKLCQAVDDLHLDYIVMGRRGIGPPRALQGMALGSVSNYVLTNTSCSGIVIKG